MLAYIPYMDPMGMYPRKKGKTLGKSTMNFHRKSRKSGDENPWDDPPSDGDFLREP